MFNITIDGVEYDLESYSSLEDILEEATDKANENKGEDEEYDIFTEADIDWSESNVYKEYQNEDCWDFIQVVNDMDRNHRNGLEIVTAGLNADVYLGKIEDSYLSEYKSDEDFAQSLCESLDLREWPYYHIDWERAANDVMGNYKAFDGYYFIA